MVREDVLAAEVAAVVWVANFLVAQQLHHPHHQQKGYPLVLVIHTLHRMGYCWQETKRNIVAQMMKKDLEGHSDGKDPPMATFSFVPHYQDFHSDSTLSSF